MGQYLQRMLTAVRIDSSEKTLFIRCSECDGFVKLGDTGYEDALCESCGEEGMERYWGPPCSQRCSEDDAVSRGPYGDD